MKHRPIALLMALVLSTTACGTADLTLSQTPAANVGADPTGKILFVADHRVQLWDAGNITALTSEEYDARSPSWAHAGDRFAFVSLADGYSDLIVADAGGNPLLQVTENEPFDEPYS